MSTKTPQTTPTTTRYRVTAPYVTVKTSSAPVEHWHGSIAERLKGTLLPEDADAGDIERLLRKGMVEAIEVTA